ncbi:PAS-domain containing protein [Frigidibacter sp. ROC022]|uniref:PAS-domain containing protein n=1 Tax=Frigidibacter sp. ROC022 TaxID=2971796 RepID=UPI00215A62FC|nr:PAS-domain containing protein [Frigidibacter sp. ROC022]MCR8724493.1 PAS-domain containing protein [Frigidibacter sp. ROC022]
MTGIDWVLLCVTLGVATGMAMATLYGLALVTERRQGLEPSIFAAEQVPAVFLFDDETLVDATPGASQLLSLTGRGGTAWSRLQQALLPRFPNLGEQMSQLVDRGALSIESVDGRSRIEAEWRRGLARLTLVDVVRQEATVPVDRMTLESIEAELATLRGIARDVPYLTWKEAPDGQIVWANAAYLEASDRVAPDQALPLWPPHPVFPARHDGAGASCRKSITFPDDSRPHWYDLSDSPMPDGVLRVAMPVDAIVEAENSRAEFVQTLTKTFATLTVGLAIFDRNRRLALFNPALTDLTGLGAGFLSRRPSLSDFIDRLREQRVLPEPKNYESWRQRLSSLEAEAEQGTFAETWTLADGQVFEVSGRPHPDGAIAFLIQDVSAEVRLTRQFRSELQIKQAVLDTLDHAVAVFGDEGELVFSNQAYDRMWGSASRLAGNDMSLPAALRLWRTNCPAAPAWRSLADPNHREALAQTVEFQAERLTGQQLECRFQPLPGGALMASFTETGEARQLSFRHHAQSAVSRM